ncbi:unnamed protein product [Polarella glacialis]|uniref:Mpv17-like protein n=1 Tax=Polarella glacialis TaxID=89957 RepID=A0A813JFS9_POLGL|nr:unnamed protein product [Polarella glacialis]CAE8680788.1 unnamed protein product [Polarella glacialis]
MQCRLRNGGVMPVLRHLLRRRRSLCCSSSRRLRRVIGLAGLAGATCVYSRLNWVQRPGRTAAAENDRPFVFLGRRPLTANSRKSVARAAWLRESAAGLWESYEFLLDSHGLLTNIVTAATLSAASDGVAQVTEAARARSAAAPPPGTEGPGGGSRAVSATGSNNNNNNSNSNNNQFNLGRTLRYAAFGFYDGFADHHWIQFLDSTLPKTGSGILDTALKVLSDSVVYTPCWCIVFLFAMAVMDGRSARAAVQEVKRDFVELLRGNYGLTLPFVVLIYGWVPVRYQVAGFQALTLAYTTVLSLWANERASQLAPGRQEETV